MLNVDVLDESGALVGEWRNPWEMNPPELSVDDLKQLAGRSIDEYAAGATSLGTLTGELHSLFRSMEERSPEDGQGLLGLWWELEAVNADLLDRGAEPSGEDREEVAGILDEIREALKGA